MWGTFRTTLAVWALCPALAFAQDGGLTAQLELSQRLQNEDDETFTRSRADFTLSSVTKHSRFEFQVGAAYELSFDDDGSADGIDDPIVRLSYAQETRRQEVGIDASFERRDISSSFAAGPELGSEVVLDDGQREDINARIFYAFGREEPFGGFVQVNYAERKFIDTIDPTLIDFTRASYESVFQFEVHPRARLRATLFGSSLDRDGGVDVDTERYGVGAALVLSSTVDADASLAFARVTESGPGADPERDGVEYALRLSEARPNGALFGFVQSDIGETGRVTQIALGRELSLRDGSLVAQVGYAFDDNDNEAPVGDIRYQQEFRRSELIIAAARGFSASSTGSELLNTRFSLEHRQRLTARTGFSLTLAYSTSDFFAALADDTERFNVRFAFNHEVTRDWDFVAGYEHTRRTSDSGADSTDDEIFLGLRATFAWRP